VRRRWTRGPTATLLVLTAVVLTVLTGCGGGRSAPGRVVAEGPPSVELRSASWPPVSTTSPASSGDVAMAPAPDHFDAPAPPPAPPPGSLDSPFAGVVPSGGTWAVVIGINHYPGGGHDLLSAVADANDTVTALSMLGVPSSHILAVMDGQATAGVIARASDWLVAHAAPDATAVFFYAGHVRKLAPTTEALVGSDGNLVTDAGLAAHFSHLAARRAWFAIAGCYGGGFEELLAPGRILTGAADANHLAYENETLGRSYMVEYMIRRAIIEGQAPATVQSAFAYASSAIAQDYPGRQPVEYEDQAGALDLRPPGTPGPATPAAMSSGGPSPAPPPPPAPPPTGAPPASTPPASTPPSSTPPTTDGCAVLTVGVVHCHP
jgi:hypothetical protein